MKKLICVLLALVMVLSLTACGANGSHKSVVKTLFASIEKGDAEKMLSLFPEEVLEAMEENLGDEDEVLEYFEDAMDSLMDEFEDMYGDDIKITYEIEDEDELDEDDIDEIIDFYEEYLDADLDIEAAYELEVEATIEGEDDDDTDEMTIFVIKIDGKWYLDLYNTSGLF